MMALFPTFILMFFVLLVSLSSSQSSSSHLIDSSSSSCLKIPPNKFLDSVKEVSTILQQLHSILSPFTNNTSEDGISVCIDLLDMSSEQLTMSISAMQNPKGKDIRGTGNLSSDLRTWLSAVLANSDTCIEGLEEGLEVKDIASTGLNRAMSLVETLLAQVIPIHVDHVNKDHFPSWIREEDKFLLRGNSLSAPDAVVAIDGSGHYRNLTSAIQAAPAHSKKRYVIHVKSGVYLDEYVKITSDKWNIMLIGDGIGATVISGSRNGADGIQTYSTASFAVDAIGFIACNISFRNTAGPMKKQAVALRSSSDLSICYRCEISGYQDSLYPHAHRQFYRECVIAGSVDFIFGDAQAVFQKCEIIVKQGTAEQNTNTITAQSRKSMNEPTGFSFQFCNISADTDLKPTTQTYLGRPWDAYSRTIFMQSYMSNTISPKGWIHWNASDFYLDTLTFGEYKNLGPGAELGSRVKWPGFHVLNESEAKKFTVAAFIDGDLWLPPSGIPYTSGL